MQNGNTVDLAFITGIQADRTREREEQISGRAIQGIALAVALGLMSWTAVGEIVYAVVG